jgi:teichuronic acid biosynthesis glycosyltransferase TuaC
MRILAITSNNLFPHSRSDHHGIFFANFLRRLLPLAERIVVVAPQGWAPGIVRRLWPGLPGRLPFHRDYFGIDVYRPAFLSAMAKRHLRLQGRLATASVLPLCRSLHSRHGFDMVLGQGFYGLSRAAVCVANDLGCKLVSWALGDDANTDPDLSYENRIAFRRDVRHSDLVLTTSAALREVVRRRVPQARHVHVFYRGADLAFARQPAPNRNELRQSLGLKPDRTYMMSAGFVLEQKGISEFYQAFRELARRRDDLSALWVGDGPDRPRLREWSNQDGLAGRLLLPGCATRADVLRYMQAADVMAFASHREGLANVLLESMAACLPVVATCVGGAAEIIAHGVSGWLVPPRDAGALAARVDHSLNDPAGSREMAMLAREFVLRHFDVEANVSVARDIFAGVIEGKDCSAPIQACAGVCPGQLPIERLQSAKNLSHNLCGPCRL